MKSYAAVVLAATIIWISGTVAVAHSSPPRRLAPPVSCTSANRMDMFVDEDNIMWECQCQMLKTGNICAWQVIGGVEAPAARRALRRRKSHPFWITFERDGHLTHYLSTFVRMP